MRKDIDMLNGPLGPAIIRFAIPVFLITLLQNLFGTADLVMIGQFCGSLEVAAISATSSVTIALVNLFTGLSLGAGLTVARALGARRTEDTCLAVHTSVSTALIGGLMLSVVGVIFSPAMLKTMDTPQDVLPLASVYIRIYFSGVIFTIVYNFGAAILRAVGDTKTPLYFLIISGILKVILNLFFLAACKLGVAGVAVASILSQAVSAGLILLALTRRTDDCRLCVKKLRMHKKPLMDILRIGLPAGIQSSLFSISNIITSTAINSFDSAAVISADGATRSLELFTDAIDIGFAQAIPNFVAQNLGARQYDRIKKSFVLCAGFGAAFIFTASMLIFLFGKQLLGLYITDSPEAISYGLLRMRYLLIPNFIMLTMAVSNGGLQGLGHSLTASVISLIIGCVLRIIWIYTVFAIPQYHTLDCLYVIYPISWILAAAVGVVLFFIFLKRILRADTPQQTAISQ